ncbi:MAG: 1-acyl-sn-glycerol-3-phosphate acyltransferase [Alphaproteobacteria bacterium]|nr:1-acyl-sn-glycerol-3-phosphate acyltransferase [Alphaproteobacteria bacterium]
MFRTVIFKIILSIYFILWAPVLLVVLPSRKMTLRAITADARGVLKLARAICGIKYHIFYPPTEENGIPVQPNDNIRTDGKAIIASKHMSIMEVAILVTNIQNPFFIVKRELFWIPIYGWSFWRMGLQPVNRTRGATNMKKLSAAVATRIMNGQTLIIFPEGTRVKPGQKIPLKRGLLFLAEQLKLPITPVGIDTGLYWPKRGKMTPGTAKIYFEDILPSTATLEEIHAAINKHSA